MNHLKIVKDVAAFEDTKQQYQQMYIFRSALYDIIVQYKPTKKTLHVSGSSSAHHQEFIHCTLGIDICHTGL
jgi:hypothetical protein